MLEKVVMFIITGIILMALGIMSAYSITAGYEPSTIDIEQTTNDEDHIEYVSIIKTVDDIVYVETATNDIYSFRGTGFDHITETWVRIHDGKIVDAWLD